MAKRQKRLLKLRALKGEVPFVLLRKVLEDHDYVLNAVRGSHFKFTREDGPHFSIPVHGGQVKSIYVQNILKKLNKW